MISVKKGSFILWWNRNLMLKGAVELDCYQWKAWAVFSVVLVSSLLVLKIHSFPGFAHYLDRFWMGLMNGTVFVLALLWVGVDFTFWQVGGPVKPLVCFKKQYPMIVLSVQEDTFGNGTFEVQEHQRCWNWAGGNLNPCVNSIHILSQKKWRDPWRHFRNMSPDLYELYVWSINWYIDFIEKLLLVLNCWSHLLPELHWLDHYFNSFH